MLYAQILCELMDEREPDQDKKTKQRFYSPDISLTQSLLDKSFRPLDPSNLKVWIHTINPHFIIKISRISHIEYLDLSEKNFLSRAKHKLE